MMYDYSLTHLQFAQDAQRLRLKRALAPALDDRVTELCREAPFALLCDGGGDRGVDNKDFVILVRHYDPDAKQVYTTFFDITTQMRSKCTRHSSTLWPRCEASVHDILRHYDPDAKQVYTRFFDMPICDRRRESIWGHPGVVQVKARGCKVLQVKHTPQWNKYTPTLNDYIIINN